MEEGKNVILKISRSARPFNSNKGLGRGKDDSIVNCKVIKEYKNHYLVQFKNYKESLLKTDFITKDIEILRG